MSDRTVIYIAAPYRSDTIDGIYRNIQRAREAARHYWQKGYAVVCPHLNSALMDGSCPDEVFLEGSMELMRRSDIVVFLDRWYVSSGCCQEHDEANRRRMSIAYEIDGVLPDLEEKTCPAEQA